MKKFGSSRANCFAPVRRGFKKAFYKVHLYKVLFKFISVGDT